MYRCSFKQFCAILCQKNWIWCRPLGAFKNLCLSYYVIIILQSTSVYVFENKRQPDSFLWFHVLAGVYFACICVCEQHILAAGA